MGTSRRFHPEQIAKLEGEQRQTLQPAAPLVELVVGLAPAVVLDIGVGTGYFAIPIARALPRARVIGLDVEPRMLAALAERLELSGLRSQVETLLSPAGESSGYPVDDRTVDLALAVNLVHELDDRSAFLAEVSRILKPGGHLVVCDWSPDGRAGFGPPVGHRIPLAKLESELGAAAFEPPEHHSLYSDLYTLTARRPG
jgi:ubiquinone/menaquinone biosynthesis C-methylase UbiE